MREPLTWNVEKYTLCILHDQTADKVRNPNEEDYSLPGMIGDILKPLSLAPPWHLSLHLLLAERLCHVITATEPQDYKLRWQLRPKPLTKVVGSMGA